MAHPPMTLPPVAPELAARLSNYMIDDRARVLLREIAPSIEPHLGEAIDQVIAGAAKLPQVAQTYQKHADEFRRIETAQFKELLKGEFATGYLECCRVTTEQETTLGYEGRARMNSSAALLRTGLKLAVVVAGKH